METVYFKADDQQIKTSFDNLIKKHFEERHDNLPPYVDCGLEKSHPHKVIRVQRPETLKTMMLFFSTPLPELFAEREYIKFTIRKRKRASQQQELRKIKKQQKLAAMGPPQVSAKSTTAAKRGKKRL